MYGADSTKSVQLVVADVNRNSVCGGDGGHGFCEGAKTAGDVMRSDKSARLVPNFASYLHRTSAGKPLASDSEKCRSERCAAFDRSTIEGHASIYGVAALPTVRRRSAAP